MSRRIMLAVAVFLALVVTLTGCKGDYMVVEGGTLGLIHYTIRTEGDSLHVFTMDAQGHFMEDAAVRTRQEARDFAQKSVGHYAKWKSALEAARTGNAK